MGYQPHAEWTPSSHSIKLNGRSAEFVNIGGLVLYTDETRLFQEFSVLTSVALARELLRLKAAGEFGKIAQLGRLALAGGEVDLQVDVDFSAATGGLY